jgi:hypothetical protein
MASALETGRNRDFWKEVRHIQKSSKTIPSVVDNANNKRDIAGVFFNKFKDLYNVNAIDYDRVGSVLSELNKRISSSNKTSHTLSANTIERLAHKLKRDKYDGLNGLNSNCIVHGCKRLYIVLAMYFSIMISHGHASEMLLLGTLCPIPKSNILNVSDKYRAIALCSSIAKLFDLVFIDKQRPHLNSDPLQFGFKKDRSTSLCTLLLTGTASKFVSEGSSVYTVLLDMSKAFDMVNYNKLFEILLRRNIDPLYTRCLVNMYCNQRLQVKWDDTLSPFFKATNGVKQGGVLSPLLFCVYVDELLCQLRQSNLGCYMGPYFVGALGYADDMVLMSPSITGMTQMLQICEKFAADYGLSFNASKTQLIVFRRRPVGRTVITIRFNGTNITEQQNVNHLGHTIYSDLSKCDTERILSSFYRQYNLFRSKFGHIPSSIQARLFETYCSSFYGCTLIPLQQTGRLQVAWRKCLRHVWRLPYQAHCALLRCLTDKLCERHTFLARFAKFALSAIKTNCDTLSYIVSCMLQTKCTFANNFKHLAELLQVSPRMTETCSPKTVLKDIYCYCRGHCKNEQNLSLASAVIELSQARDKIMDTPLTRDEVCDIIRDICLN